jgi:lipoate-protein ligase A
MHGEYKTPGGKLVVVDFTVEEDEIREAMISGDFFLYPEEALGEMTGALNGLSVRLTESEIAERVRMALPRSAELLGTSPDAIGAAVKRGLASETGATSQGATGDGG